MSKPVPRFDIERRESFVHVEIAEPGEIHVSENLAESPQRKICTLLTESPSPLFE